MDSVSYSLELFLVSRRPLFGGEHGMAPTMLLVRDRCVIRYCGLWVTFCMALFALFFRVNVMLFHVDVMSGTHVPR